MKTSVFSKNFLRLSRRDFLVSFWRHRLEKYARLGDIVFSEFLKKFFVKNKIEIHLILLKNISYICLQKEALSFFSLFVRVSSSQFSFFFTPLNFLPVCPQKNKHSDTVGSDFYARDLHAAFQTAFFPAPFFALLGIYFSYFQAGDISLKNKPR
jgi:hypothetical protein